MNRSWVCALSILLLARGVQSCVGDGEIYEQWDNLTEKSYYGFAELILNVTYTHWLLNSYRYPEEQEITQPQNVFRSKILARTLFKKPTTYFPRALGALQNKYPRLKDAHTREFRSFCPEEIHKTRNLWNYDCRKLKNILLEQERCINRIANIDLFHTMDAFYKEEVDLFMCILKAYAPSMRTNSFNNGSKRMKPLVKITKGG